MPLWSKEKNKKAEPPKVQVEPPKVQAEPPRAKAAEKTMQITNIRLLEKRGGKSDFVA